MNRPVIKTASRRLLLWAVLLMAISGCAFLLLVWQPRQAELAAMTIRQGEIRKARLELEGFHRRHPDLPRFEQVLAVRGERAERLFPKGEDEGENFFRWELPELAESMGLSIEQIAVGEEPAKAGQSNVNPGQILKPVSCGLTLRGQYGALTDFLVRLEQGEPFAAVKRWQLKPGADPNRKGELTLDLVVEIYERR